MIYGTWLTSSFIHVSFVVVFALLKSSKFIGLGKHLILTRKFVVTAAWSDTHQKQECMLVLDY